MGTSNKSELKARKWMSTMYPLGVVIKLPDHKQTGGWSSGLPDYLAVENGKHHWYEVKLVSGENLFPFSALSDSQWVRFRQLSAAGAIIDIVCYTPLGKRFVFSFVRLCSFYGSGSSVLFSKLLGK